jgi:arylsulfatase A-like enzyme
VHEGGISTPLIAHWPMHALKEDVARYHGKYDAGYASVRQARLLRMQQMGLIDKHAELSPTFGDWSQVPDQAWEARCMEVYAAMIDRMDQGIGRVVGSLEKHHLLQNTLILFLQDNGGCQEPIGRQAAPPERNHATSSVIAQDAIRLDIIPKQTRDGKPVQQGQGIMPGGPNDYIAYGEAWANVSNPPIASTSTSCMKAASPPRSSPTGPPAFRRHKMAKSSTRAAISLISWPPVQTSPEPATPPNTTDSRSSPWQASR